MLKHPPTQLPFQVFWSLFLEHVSAGKGGVFSMFPKKLSIILFISACSQEIFPSFSSSQHVPKRFFHHSLHLFVLPDAPTTGLSWKKVAHSQCPQKKPFHHSLHLFVLLDTPTTGLRWKKVAHSQCSQKNLSIILFIPACSQEIFPSFPSSLGSP
jgi:hypothetical protein